MPTIADVRSQYPQYNDLSDAELADKLHSAFYADMPREQFDAKIGMKTDPIAGETTNGTSGVRFSVDDIPRQLGLTARTVAQGTVGTFGDLANTIANLGIAGVNKVTGAEIPSFRMPSEVIDKSGVFPEPRTPIEKGVDLVGREVVANAVPLGAAAKLARVAVPGETASVAQNVARTVAEHPATDLAVGVGAGAGDIAADELAPDSQMARLLAPILGGVVGGVGFAGAASKLRELAAARRGVPLETAGEPSIADINAHLSNEQDLLAVAKAAGIENADDPRLALLREKLAQRRTVEAERPANPQAVDVDQLRAEIEAEKSGEVSPAAANVAQPREPVPEVIIQGRQVAPAEAAPAAESPPAVVAGRAIDPGTQAGFEANGGRAAIEQRALPPPGAETRPTAMTPQEVAQAQARGRAEVAPPRVPPEERAAPPERLVAPEERAPQTPTQVAEQRQAGEAFRAADAQRERVAPETRDTQAAGLPKGPEPVQVHTDQGFPVQIVSRTMEPGPDGRLVETATVRRYDPRTSQPEADAVDYKVPVRDLRASTYQPEPRRAQDFAERAAGPPTPEVPSADGAPVQREPTQTFRQTPPDANQDFPGAASGEPPAGGGGRGPAEGRSPLPEQPPPGEGQRFKTTSDAEAEFVAREAARKEAGGKARAERDAGQQARAEAQAKYANAKTSSTAGAADADGRFPTDEFGFVKSDKEGPVKFADQKQAARWIVNEGHKKSPDQIFEIENHPSGNGFTVRERGRAEPPPAGGAGPGGEGPKPNGSAKSENPEPPPGGEGGRGAVEAEPRASAGEGGSAEPASAAAENGTRAPSEPAEGKPAKTAEAANKAGELPVLADAAETAKHLSDGGATFYSNPLSDTRVWKAVAREVGLGVETVTKNARDSIEQIGAIRAKAAGNPNATVLEAPRYLARALMLSNDGRLRSLARRTGIDAFQKIADLIQPTGTEGRAAVGRGYQEAFHMRMRERGNDLNAVLAHVAETKGALEQVRRSVVAGKTTGDTPIAKAAAAVSKILKEELDYRRAAGVETGEAKNYFPRMLDTLEVVKSPDKFEAALAKEYRATGLSTKDAAEAAKVRTRAILDAEAGADGLDFSRVTPGTRSEKARSFGASADTTLAPWLVTDPAQALMRYIASTTKRVELATRFGLKNEKLKELLDEITAKGGRQFAGEAIDAFQASTGQLRADRVPASVQHAIGWLRVDQTVGLLEKATISSMNDLVGPAVRSGKMRDVPKAVARYIQQMAGWGIDARERAELLGTIGKGYEGALMLARSGTDPTTRMQSLITQKFFLANLLEQHTNAARVAAQGLLEAEMKTYARDIADSRRGAGVAGRRLEELGVARGDQKAFSQWLLSDGATDTAALKGDTGHAESYRTAIFRGVNMAIMDPNASLKPFVAAHPVGSLVYHLQSFNFAFTKLLYRVGSEAYTAATGKNWRSGEGAGLTGAERLSLLGPAMVLPVMYAVGYGMSAARDNVLDAIGEAITGTKAQTRRDKSTTEKVIEAGSRAGLYGALDPLVNAASGVRYGKEPLVALLGPAAGTISTNVKNILAPNSDRTNTKERNMAGAAYSLFVEPAMNAGISLASPSPWLSFALMAGGSGNPAIKNGWQTWFSGPKQLRVQKGQINTDRVRAADPGRTGRAGATRAATR